MEIEKLDYREAVEILAKDAGIELKTSFSREKTGEFQDIYALYRATAEWYHGALFLPENKDALDYLLDRHLSLETIQKFQLGYSSSPRDLLYHLKWLGFAEKFIIDSGIFVSPSRDKFFGRIIFPIANFLWHVVAFTGRVRDTSLPKYLNSPTSKIFNKSSILYGLHLAKWPASKAGSIIIVEGQMDTIALHQAGFENAVGISGTALTEEHIKILKRFTKKIYLSLDSDNAGVNATFSSLENTMNHDIDVRVITIKNGKDPDGFIRDGGDFQACIDDALSPIDFYIQEGQRKHDITSPIGKKSLIDDMIAFLLSVTSHTERDIYIDTIANRMQITKDSLYTEIQKHTRTRRSSRSASQESTEVTPRDTGDEKTKVTDHIAGYIVEYNFYDLFFEYFRYTLEDLIRMRDFDLLVTVLQKAPLNENEQERISLVSLLIEDENSEKTQDNITLGFRILVQKLHEILFRDERDRVLTGLDMQSKEYMEAYAWLLGRLKTLWLSQDSMRR